MTTAEPLLTATPADAVLNVLPHPVIVVSADGKVVDANVAAEAFFEVSAPLLRRHLVEDLVPFGSPLLTLVEQVRASGAAVNEYKVDLGTPRNPGDPRWIGSSGRSGGGRLGGDAAGRSIADKMDRQLTHRGAAPLPVIALAAMLAHGIEVSGIGCCAARRSCSSSRSTTTTAR